MQTEKMKVSWWRTSFGDEEIERVTHSIRNEHISQGKVTAELESKLAEVLGVPYAQMTTSGSVALLLAMMTLGIKRDDEIILPNRTWIATAHAPLMLGAKVVLVDVLPDIPVMDVSQIRKKITSRTKAIVPVHLCGRAVNMDEIQEVAKEYGLVVIEDACQALFSKNRNGYLGTQSDAGCFSLGVTKLISTGQGGAVVMKSRETYERMKLLRNHGVIDSIDPAYSQVSCNLRFTDILASIGIAQMDRAAARLAYVKKVYKKYEDSLGEFPFLKLIPVKLRHGEVPLYVEVLCKDRKKLMSFLISEGIDVCPFLPNLSQAPYLKTSETFPNSDIFNEQGLFLPSGPDQPMENIDYVLDVLREYKKSNPV